MKILKVALVVLVTGVLLASLFGCGDKADSTAASTQTSTVKRGDISNTITAAGNLALAVTEDLPVSLFYQGSSGRGGTVGQVLVQVGDTVKQGQVLISMDPAEWADQLQNLQDSISTARRNVTNKTVAVTDAQRQLAALQRAVATAQRAVTAAERTVELKKMAVTSAELSVQSANNTLNQTADVKKAKDAIDEILLKLKLAGTGDSYYWSTQVDYLQASLVGARAYYNDIVSGTGVTSSTDVALLIAQKALAVTQAQAVLVDAQRAVDDALTAVDTARQGVDDANYAVTKQQQTVVNAQADLDSADSSLADAQNKLADAQAMSPEIKAPFDGFVTAVNVKAGQSVYNGTIAAIVADPNKFEADILVSEMDIMKVSVGGDATMALNAVLGVTLPAQIIKIAPTATISSGVVNYSVTVNITSIAPATPGSFPAGSANATGRFPGASANTTGRSPAGGGFSDRAGAGLGSSGSRAAGQLPSTLAAQNYQLKPGLTGTVELIVAQSSNVLLVPNGAVTRAGNQSTVQVLTANNTTEKRVVQTGLSDWQNTEITSGLTEGEKIIVPKTTATTATTTSSTSQQRPPGGGIFFGR